MKHIPYLLALPLCLLACSPENEEVKDEYVDVAPPADALDSIANVPKDAVKTDENDIKPTIPLPQPVMELLSEKYRGWEKPEIAANASRQAEAHESTAAVARGDFNGDGWQDVALQLQQGKDVVMVVAFQTSDYEYELVELRRDILFNERGTLKSLYYLFTVPQDEELQSEETGQEIELAHDALAIGMESNTTAYVYQNGSFQSYTIAN